MRSTDVNLTLQSAYANLLGMYFNRSAHKMDVNYPGIDGWPNGFVPVAAHTILRNLDHVIFSIFIFRNFIFHTCLELSTISQL